MANLEWSEEDKEFLQAIGRLISSGWRAEDRYVHYQQIHARLQMVAPNQYSEDEVERFCLRVFDMGGDGYMRRKRIYRHFNVRILKQDERLVKTQAKAATAEASPMDDADMADVAKVDDTDLQPWLKALPEILQETSPDGKVANDQDAHGKMPIPSGEAVPAPVQSRKQQRVKDRQRQPSRIRLAVAFVPVVAVAVLLVFLPHRLVKRLVSAIGRNRKSER